MIKQKVITINIQLNSNLDKEDGIGESEPKILNDYLSEGYRVVDRFSTVSNGSAYLINITFILEKEE